MEVASPEENWWTSRCHGVRMSETGLDLEVRVDADNLIHERWNAFATGKNAHIARYEKAASRKLAEAWMGAT